MLRPSYSSTKFGLFHSSKLFRNHHWYNARGISFTKSKDRDAMSSSEDQALAESTPKLGELSLKPGAIASFIASPESFTIISTIGPSSKTGIKKLYILDSSFNPPTLAHKHIAKSAYLYDDPTIKMREKRLLILLAIQNADKPAQPASFEQRLTMMRIFASEIFSGLGDLPDTGIDIGLTKLPYFHSKAVAIEESGLYDSSEPVRQVYLTGYDTLVRILNPEYYPPLKNLTPLELFFSKHQLLVQYRPDDKWGSMQEQDEFLKPLRRGDLEKIGGKKEWGDRIELRGGDFEAARVVSSTKVRQAVKKGDKVALSGLVTDKVADYILKEKLYLEG